MGGPVTCGCGVPTCGGGCGQPSRFTDITGEGVQNTLGRQLIPVADDLRDLFTQFGLRPYKVHIIKTRWAGRKRGDGVETVVSSRTILPTPLVTDLTALNEIVTPVGLDEEGGILLQEISGCFTEDDLRGHQEDGTPVAANEQLYYEIEFPKPNGEDSERRRFHMRSAPMYFADNFAWQVRLERAREDRNRAGEPR